MHANVNGIDNASSSTTPQAGGEAVGLPDVLSSMRQKIESFNISSSKCISAAVLVLSLVHKKYERGKRRVSKRTLYTKVDNGSLPLHSAVRYQAPAGVVMLLLESAECRCTLLESDVFGQLPLHAACRNGAHPDVIDLLLRYDEGKSTVMREDHVG